MRILAVLFVTLTINANGAGAQTSLSGNDVVPECRVGGKEFVAGICFGVLSALALVGGDLREEFRVCVPADVTSNQLARVLIEFTRERPQQMHLDFRFIALAALRGAWPCR